MAGMLRCKDDKELNALLKGSHVRVRQPGGVRFVPQDPLVRVDARDRSLPKSATCAKKQTDTQEESEIERMLAEQIQLAGLPVPEHPYYHLRGRSHHLDFAWPEWTVNGWQFGLEVQGMAHRVKDKFLRDIEKRFLAQQQGWLVLEVAGDHVRDGRAIEWLQILFKRAVRK